MFIYQLLVDSNGVSREGLLRVIAFIFALVIALVLHEISHGLVALWNGDNTAKAMGRLSLNPLRHFDTVGFVMMLLVGFGWARPVPVNPNNFRHKKWGAFSVSVAGVATNLVLAFIFALPLVLIGGTSYGSTAAFYTMYTLMYFSYFMVILNVYLALFNVLPLFPLDGYRLVASLTGENNKVMRFLRKYSLYVILFLIVWDTLCKYIPALNYFSPFYWYITWLGDKIKLGFTSFWGLFV